MTESCTIQSLRLKKASKKGINYRTLANEYRPYTLVCGTTWGGVKLMFNFLVGPHTRHIASPLPHYSPQTSPHQPSDLTILPWLFMSSSVLYLWPIVWETFSEQVLNALHALKLTFLPSSKKLGTDEDPQIVSVTLFNLRRWPLFFSFFCARYTI